MKKKTAKKSYSADHVAVILEDLSGQFKVFGEEQKSLSDKVDRMDVRLSKVEDKVTESGVKLSVMSFGLEEIKRNVKDSYKSSREYLSNVEKEIKFMKAETKELKANLKSKADLERILNYEKRLMKIEKIVLAKRA